MVAGHPEHRRPEKVRPLLVFPDQLCGPQGRVVPLDGRDLAVRLGGVVCHALSAVLPGESGSKGQESRRRLALHDTIGAGEVLGVVSSRPGFGRVAGVALVVVVAGWP